MGQHPPSYESDPYPTSAQGAGPTPSPYGVGPTGPGASPYGGAPPYGVGPARPGTPPYGGASAYGGAPPYAPAPMPVLPPTPEQAAEKSLRTARGLGMGAAITGLVSVIIQGIAPLGILLPLGASDSWSVEDVLIWLMAALLSIMLVPLIVIVIWATCFGLSLAACIVANTRRSTPLPARWAGIGGVTGGVLAASIFQGAPLTIIILTAANEGATGDSGPAAATAAILVAVALFFVHVVLISKLRTLGSGVEPGAAAPGRPGFTPAPPGPHRY